MTPPSEDSTATGEEALGPERTPAATPEAEGETVSGLTVERNTADLFEMVWGEVPQATSYDVLLNGYRIARVEEPTAWIAWEVPSVRFGVAPIVDGEVGEVTELEVVRPAE